MNKYALIIGISRYDDPEICNLNYAADDAREVGVCLREVCRFDDVRTLVSGGEREPDHLTIVETLHSFAPLLNRDDLFLFYFAGHGIHTANGSFLLACNSRIRMPELTAVPMPLLQQCLSRLDAAERVLILDACRNDPHHGRGDSDNLLTQEFSRDILAVAKASVEGVVPSTCVLFSCSEGERAYEWADRRHGAFTWYLLEGLRGAARDKRGRITVQGLSRYVEDRVLRWSQKMAMPRKQTPWAQQQGSLRDITLFQQDQAVQGQELPQDSNVERREKLSAPSSGTPAKKTQETAKPSSGMPCISPVLAELIKKLDNDRWELRLEAVKMIGSMGEKGRDALPYVAKLISDTDHDVREAVCRVLLNLGIDDRCLPGLADGLRADSWKVRYLACQIAGESGPRAAFAIDAVSQCLSDSDSDVREMAEWAVRRISGDITVRKPRSHCFISTAVAEALRWGDNSPELNLLRRFRDSYMSATSDRRSEVVRYYLIAPQIVRAINERMDSSAIWERIAFMYILKAVSFIEEGRLADAHNIYRRMVSELETRYLSDKVI